MYLLWAKNMFFRIYFFSHFPCSFFPISFVLMLMHQRSTFCLWNNEFKSNYKKRTEFNSNSITSTKNASRWAEQRQQFLCNTESRYIVQTLSFRAHSLSLFFALFCRVKKCVFVDSGKMNKNQWCSLLPITSHKRSFFFRLPFTHRFFPFKFQHIKSLMYVITVLLYNKNVCNF